MPRMLPVMLAMLVAAGCDSASDEAAGPPPTTASSGPVSPTAAADTDYVAIPRTSILLRPPTGMQVDASLPGLSRGTGSRTTVILLEQQFKGKSAQDTLAELASGIRGDKGKAQGIEMGEARNLMVAGHPAIAMTGTQRAAGVTFAKAYVALTAGEKIIVMSGSIAPGDPLSADALLEVLTSARWSEMAAPGGFGFDLTAAPGYQREEGSAGITFKFGEGTDAAKFIATPSIGAAAIQSDRRREYANERFAKLPHSPSVSLAQDVQISSQPGFELTGRDSRGRTVYAVILFTDGGYIMLVGDFDSTKHSDQLPAFRAMAQSLVIQ